MTTNYVHEVAAALRVWAGNNAEALDCSDNHKRLWRQRLREYGYGLGDLLQRGQMTDAQVHGAVSSAYSTMYVVNAFGRGAGVLLHARDVVAAIRDGIAQAQEGTHV